jgi:hypothetical protein
MARYANAAARLSTTMMLLVFLGIAATNARETEAHYLKNGIQRKRDAPNHYAEHPALFEPG